MWAGMGWGGSQPAKASVQQRCQGLSRLPSRRTVAVDGVMHQCQGCYQHDGRGRHQLCIAGPGAGVLPAGGGQRVGVAAGAAQRGVEEAPDGA